MNRPGIDIQAAPITVDMLLESLLAAKAEGIVTGDSPVTLGGGYGDASEIGASDPTPNAYGGMWPAAYWIN